MDERIKFSRQPEISQASVIVGWTTDAGKLGTAVTDYLIQKIEGQEFCSLDPVEFFPLNGVVIEKDLVQFPESRFYAGWRRDIVVFQSYPPISEWHKFNNLLLDVAEKNCQVKELYIVGGMLSLSAHTTPREIMGTYSSIEMKRNLSAYDMIGEVNYETPAGQKPTLNSFLLWEAQKRGISAVVLWIQIPFYLVNVGDQRAKKALVEFFGHRLDLNIDTEELKEAAMRQNIKIGELRNENPLVNEYLNKLETNLRLTEEETQKLIYEIENILS